MRRDFCHQPSDTMLCCHQVVSISMRLTHLSLSSMSKEVSAIAYVDLQETKPNLFHCSASSDVPFGLASLVLLNRVSSYPVTRGPASVWLPGGVEDQCQ